MITNWPKDKVEHVHAANFPGRGEEGYKVPCSRVCYIERSDFKTEDVRGYYGLAPGKSIMLRCAAKLHLLEAVCMGLLGSMRASYVACAGPLFGLDRGKSNMTRCACACGWGLMWVARGSRMHACC